MATQDEMRSTTPMTRARSKQLLSNQMDDDEAGTKRNKAQSSNAAASSNEIPDEGGRVPKKARSHDTVSDESDGMNIHDMLKALKLLIKGGNVECMQHVTQQINASDARTLAKLDEANHCFIKTESI